MSGVDELPEPDPTFDERRFVGAWWVLVSNDPDWRERTHPRVEFERVGERLVEQRRFRVTGLLGRRPRVEVDSDRIVRSGEFERPGGPLALGRVRWSVPLFDAAAGWAVLFRARSRLGHPPSLDLVARGPSIEQALLDVVLARVRGHAFLGARVGGELRCAGLYAPVHDWRPPRPYRLG
jgi:hypothetical protein